MGLIPAFLWARDMAVYPVTQQNNTGLGEIRSKKHRNFMDCPEISFSPDITGYN